MDTARIFSGALLLAATALAACSASKGTNLTDPAAGAADGGVASDAASASDSSTTTTNPPAKDASVADAATGQCSGEATQTACVQCCSTAHQDGAGAYLVATIDCMCLPANCETECAATLCNADNPKNPDTKCGACVQGKNGACAQAIKTACTADPECVAFDACVGESSCTAK